MLNYICVAVEKKSSTEAEKVLSHVENINLRKQDGIANGHRPNSTLNKRGNQAKMKSTVCYEIFK
jgi:hypothetical protein